MCRSLPESGWYDRRTANNQNERYCRRTGNAGLRRTDSPRNAVCALRVGVGAPLTKHGAAKRARASRPTNAQRKGPPREATEGDPRTIWGISRAPLPMGSTNEDLAADARGIEAPMRRFLAKRAGARVQRRAARPCPACNYRQGGNVYVGPREVLRAVAALAVEGRPRLNDPLMLLSCNARGRLVTALRFPKVCSSGGGPPVTCAAKATLQMNPQGLVNR